MPYTESSSEITSENTTTTDETINSKNDYCGGKNNFKLIFPSKIIPAQQRSISKLLLNYPDDAQLIVDELAGRMKITDVLNVVGYVKGILNNTDNEGFVPELGLAITEAREVNKKREEENRLKQIKLNASTVLEMKLSSAEQICILNGIVKKRSRKKNV
ncbi:MAG: hypothetical protein QM484_11400 [Woeseiaceae bacterium]